MGCCNSKDQRWAFQGPTNLLEPLRQSFAVRNPDYVVVVVRLQELRQLKAGNHLGTNTDPFVELSLQSKFPLTFGDQKQRSSLKSNTTNPKWFPAERFQFKVSYHHLHDTKIVLNIFHFLPVLAPVSIGDGVIFLKEYELGDMKKNMQYKLLDSGNGKQEGSCYVSVEVMSAEQAANTQDHNIYEFQRWKGDWGTIDCFILTDPGRWSSIDGKNFGNEIDDIAPTIPKGWAIVRDWMTGVTDSDPDGWEYSTDMRSNYWHPTDGAEGSLGFSLQMIRRRVWSRKIAKLNSHWWDSSYSDPNHM
jgi:hypothetical protein